MRQNEICESACHCSHVIFSAFSSPEICTDPNRNRPRQPTVFLLRSFHQFFVPTFFRQWRRKEITGRCGHKFGHLDAHKPCRGVYSEIRSLKVLNFSSWNKALSWPAATSARFCIAFLFT